MDSIDLHLIQEFLSKQLDNQIITDFIIFDNKNNLIQLIQKNFVLVENINTKGNLLYFILFNYSKKIYITIKLIHGRFSLSKNNKSKIKCIIKTKKNKSIYFYDKNKSSIFKIPKSKNAFDLILNKIGPDILSEEFDLNLNYFIKSVKNNPNLNITIFLTDQKIISGISNFLKSEILFYSEISPKRFMKSLSNFEIEKLFEGIIFITRKNFNSAQIPKHIRGNIFNTRLAKKIKTCDGHFTYFDPKTQI